MTEKTPQHERFDDMEYDEAFHARSEDRRFLAQGFLLCVGVFLYAAYALLEWMTAAPDARFALVHLIVLAPLVPIGAVFVCRNRFRDRSHPVLIACGMIIVGALLHTLLATDEPPAERYAFGIVAIVFPLWVMALPSFRQSLAMTLLAMLALALIVTMTGVQATAAYTTVCFAGLCCMILVVGMFFLESTERSQEAYRRELGRTIDTLRASEHRAVELYHEAKQAEKAKDEFLAVVSHELRTPMNAIIGFSEIISSEMMGKIQPPQYQEYAVHIRDSGQQLLSLINDILDVSRSEIDKISFNMRPFDIGTTVDSAITACSTDAEQSDITVMRAGPGQRDITVEGDESRMLQAMTNIIGNAIKFSERGGTVIVDLVADRDGSVQFKATDSGIGISVENIETIKQPFRQADSAFVRNNGGLGLGLAICNIVANAHKGELLIESALGKGTTVSIVLPPPCEQVMEAEGAAA